MNLHKRLFAGITIIAAGIAIAWPATMEFLAADACVDAGGSFNYIEGACDMNASHRQEARPLHSWRPISIGFVLVAIGMMVMFRRSGLSRESCIKDSVSIQPLAQECASPQHMNSPAPGGVKCQSMMDQFETCNMASGGLALVLEPIAKWDQFPELAQKWAAILNAEAASSPIITANECLLAVTIDGGEFWITYDDWQESIQLEPQEKEYNHIVLSLQNRLRKVL